MVVCPRAPPPASSTGRGPASGIPLGVLGERSTPGALLAEQGAGARAPTAGALHPPEPATAQQAPSHPPTLRSDTSKLHISSDMKTLSFDGEAAVNGAKLCMSSFCDVIYYRPSETELRPSAHFS